MKPQARVGRGWSQMLKCDFSSLSVVTLKKVLSWNFFRTLCSYENQRAGKSCWKKVLKCRHFCIINIIISFVSGQGHGYSFQSWEGARSGAPNWRWEKEPPGSGCSTETTPAEEASWGWGVGGRNHLGVSPGGRVEDSETFRSIKGATIWAHSWHTTWRKD